LEGKLTIASIHLMDEIHAQPSEIVEGFYNASWQYFYQSLYKESMACLKTSLFNAVFMLDENPLEIIDMDYFIKATRKLDEYKLSIDFLSQFQLLHDHGLPLNQIFLNECGITRKELEYEHESRTYYKLDDFYEIVAKDDFPLIQSYLSEKKKQSKYLLTQEQLLILTRKLQEKSDIIKSLKAMSAKCDMLMNINIQAYEKQCAIMDATTENKKMLKTISDNTEVIIENIHKKNISRISEVDAPVITAQFEKILTPSLWKKLHENTKKSLMLAEHLYEANKFSTFDEFGFIAIEYSKAIENEFVEKVIKIFLKMKKIQSFKYVDDNREVKIHERTTLGTITYLVKKMSTLRGTKNDLGNFKKYIQNSLIGKENLYSFEKILTQISKIYRNPAAHPTPYPREKIDNFRNLLFNKSFLKDFFHSIQFKS
jgi:hypothetical protein